MWGIQNLGDAWPKQPPLKKTVMLGGILALAMIMGWLDAGPLRGGQQEATLLIVHAALSAILIYFWFSQDVIQRAYRPSLLLRVGVLLLSVFALPYYFFRARGAAGGAMAIMLMLGIFVVAMLLYRAGTGLAR